ncbi:MAG: hypothetical protein BECKG1743E_GA0114224_103365, partial [Candidatus Kentron sp. G]
MFFSGNHLITNRTSLRPGDFFTASDLLRPSKFEGHCPMIRHGCRMALMV